MTLVLAVLSGFGLALVAPLIARLAPRQTGWIIALLPLALTAYFVGLVSTVAEGQTIGAAFEWAPSLGVALSFRIDGLSLLFALLICGIGTLIMVYAGAYLSGHPDLGRFFLFILAFMASMLGAVLSDNVFALFIFWELTSITSFLLIGFEHERSTSRDAALQALLVTGGGGLALLAGLVLLAQIGGSSELSVLIERGAQIQGDPLYGVVLALVLLGAFTKSAQFPFHYWLPNAMEAPTPVSAYLHSATMVKLGVYLLARMSPALGGTDAWQIVVTGFGIITALIGGYLALTQVDLKRILAYSTISALGTLVLLLGVGTHGAVGAAVVFLLAHALYKGALFMIAGAVDHETGTRDTTRLGGLARAMPITAAAATLAAISLSGFGPVLSFIGKEMLLEAVLESERAQLVLTLAAVLSGTLFVAVAAIVVIRPFYGAPVDTPKHPHEAPVGLWLGPALLAVLGPLLALLPILIAGSIVSPAASAIVGEPQEIKLALWHGINPALALSFTSVVLGLALFVLWERLRSSLARLASLIPGPEWWYTAGLAWLDWMSNAITNRLQSGYLRRYVLTVLGTAAGLVGFTLLSRGEIPAPSGWPDVRFYEVALAGLILVAARVAVSARSRLTAVTALGVVGYGTALIYLMFGAPDLAMTQILIETLTVLLYVLVFYHLPHFADLTSRVARTRDALVAIGAGALMTVLVLTASTIPLDPTLSNYLATNSYAQAHGRNIVNVILVDFRALDTLGEITVLSLAAVGVYAMLRLRPTHEESE